MSSPVTDALVGTVLDGRYRIRSHIADGGMASVYVALDERLDREIALKIMKPSLASDPAFVERFQREARSAARLSHPGVVAVFDQGSDGDRVFLAMELVKGHTLREVMQAEGPLTPRAALDLIDQALQALGAAHAAGLVHRDVKPENVLLREDGAVKVADFGLMRAAVTGTGTATAQTGVLLGTVAYLSPEQVERGIADARSDVYAAGLMLFEMLTGTKAFTGETALQIAYQHVHGQVPAPSSRIRTLPAELDHLVALATSRDPDDRPLDARALLREVRQVRATLSAEQLDRRPHGAQEGRWFPPQAPTVAVAQAGDGGAPASDGLRTEVMSVPRPGAQPGARAPTTEYLPLPASPATTTMPAPRHLGAGVGATAVPAGRGPEDSLGSPADPVPPGRRRHRGAWLLFLMVLVAAAAAVWYFLGGPGAATTVPVVAGQTQAAATSRLAAAHLSARVERAYSESVKSGIVIGGDPRSGASLPRDGTVLLTVSRGPERHRVAMLRGQTRSSAEQKLAGAHLGVGTVDSAYDAKVPEGQVISSDPKAGTSLRRDATVNLVVSKGPRPVIVADWTGRPAADAVTALTGQGLKVSEQQEFSTTVAKSSVIRQNPSAGTSLSKGDRVSLVVSNGPEGLTVPDVVLKAVADAQRILKDAGFKVQVNDVVGGGLIGRVTAQFPGAGSVAPAGSVVTLTVL